MLDIETTYFFLNWRWNLHVINNKFSEFHVLFIWPTKKKPLEIAYPDKLDIENLMADTRISPLKFSYTCKQFPLKPNPETREIAKNLPTNFTMT